jgi:hypothetical protein
MIRYRVSLSALAPLLLMTALTACVVRVKDTAGEPATPVQRHGHVTQPAPGPRHGHVSQPAPGPRHGHVTQPAPGPRHGHVTQPAPGPRHGHVSQAPGAAPDACAVHTGTGCYWMENESGRYCWVPADLANTYEGCYAMDSCDGGKGESNGGCYKWADSSHAERARWPNG